jgi:hypothetical protein
VRRIPHEIVPTSPPSLAAAFLALSDGPAPSAARPLRRKLCAVAAALVLACAAPLAWDQSTATFATKQAITEELEE